ncbi:MAG: response regulator transcription factor [Burkholderiales bacterium]
MTASDRTSTVFVVDDDEAVRASLRLLLKSLGMPAVTYGSAAEFLAQYDPEQPGCIILDVRMPGMSGLELQDELNRRGAIIPVIFVTGHGDVPMAVEAMQHGAADFLQKPFSDKDLTDRIQRALSADLKNRAVLGEKDQIRARLAALTSRERQVLRLVVLGKPNKVIAGDLGISQRTVEIHRAHLMEKMGATSIAHLVRMTMIADTSTSTY